MIKDALVEGNIKVVAIGFQTAHGISYNTYRLLSVDDSTLLGRLEFQKGAVADSGVNGLTLEALIQVCKHRLTAFQATEFNSPYNQSAIEHLQLALDALNARTADRREREVEGQMEK